MGIEVHRTHQISVRGRAQHGSADGVHSAPPDTPARWYESRLLRREGRGRKEGDREMGGEGGALPPEFIVLDRTPLRESLSGSWRIVIASNEKRSSAVKGLKRVRRYSSLDLTKLPSVTCHTGSHSITCHPTQVN